MSEAVDRLFGLAGEVAVITGATGCIGSEAAAVFAARGAKLVLVASRGEVLQRMAGEIESQGADVLPVAADISRKPQVEAMTRKALDRFGRIDILINCAGIAHLQDAVDFEEQAWDRVMEVNLKGTFLACQAVGRSMVERRKGRIVNISSVRGLQGRARDVAYAPSKGAINQLTRSLAIEWAPYGINVNAIAPTFVHSHINDALLDDLATREWVLGRIPKRRIAEAGDIAGPLVFLCSPGAEFVTGQILYVDGGWTAA